MMQPLVALIHFVLALAALFIGAAVITVFMGASFAMAKNLLLQKKRAS